MKFVLGLACALPLLTAVTAAQGQSCGFLASMAATRFSDAYSATGYLAAALEKDHGEQA